MPIVISALWPDWWRSADAQGTYDRLNEMLNRELSTVLSLMYSLPMWPYVCLSQPVTDYRWEGNRSGNGRASCAACKHLESASSSMGFSLQTLQC